MLHLVISFASKSENCSSHIESLKMREISSFASILLQKRQNGAFKRPIKDPVHAQCDSNNWPIVTDWDAKGIK